MKRLVLNHYEVFFENILRENGVLYLSIDETRKPIYDEKKIKNFDFIVSSFNGKFLIDIKGKQFPYPSARRFNVWENWIKEDDISGLKLWSSHFNAFTPLLVYPYLLTNNSYKKLFTDIFTFQGKTYCPVAIELSDYYTAAKSRSKSWNAIHVPPNEFQKLIRPISYFIPELKKNW